MRGGLLLEIAPLAIGVELAGERALDVLGSRVMSIDEIAVVAVHDAHESGEIRRRARMQRMAESGGCSGKLGDGVGQGFRYLFQPRRLDPVDALDAGRPRRFGRFL